MALVTDRTLNHTMKRLHFIASKARTYLLLSLVVFMSVAQCFIASPAHAELTEDNFNAINGGWYWYKLPQCAAPLTGSNITTGAQFPNLDPAAMAKAIDTWIKKENPKSKLNGMGSVIVASAKQANVNPFLIVSIAKKESSLADPGDYNVSHGNNSFGRQATASQPHFQGSQTWYKWSSVKASVDSTAPENQNAKGGGDIASYLRAQYGSRIDQNDIASIMQEYAPPNENNTKEYVAEINKWVAEMVKLSGGSTGSTTTGGGTTTLPEKGDYVQWTMKFFVGKGLTPAQAAGIVGNLEQESGQGLNPEAAGGGIAQWIGTRWPPLEKYAHDNYGQSAQSGNGPKDLMVQVNYLWKELNAGYSKVLANLKATSTVEDAVHQFVGPNDRSGHPVPASYNSFRSGGYENPGQPEEQNRVKYAKEALAKYGGGVLSSDNCGGGATTTANCNVTKPVYTAQYSQAQLAKIFGNPGSASSHPDMDKNLTKISFIGHNVQVNKLVAGCLQAVAQDIQNANIKYTIKSMGCYRFDSNNGTSNIGLSSYHTYGAACDINPDTNPFVIGGTRPHDMPQQYIDIFNKHGFTWGGNWHTRKDYMHFEFHGIMP